MFPDVAPSCLWQILYHTPDKDGDEFRRLEEALAAVCETVDAINDKVQICTLSPGLVNFLRKRTYVGVDAWIKPFANN